MARQTERIEQLEAEVVQLGRQLGQRRQMFDLPPLTVQVTTHQLIAPLPITTKHSYNFTTPSAVSSPTGSSAVSPMMYSDVGFELGAQASVSYRGGNLDLV